MWCKWVVYHDGLPTWLTNFRNLSQQSNPIQSNLIQSKPNQTNVSVTQILKTKYYIFTYRKEKKVTWRTPTASQALGHCKPLSQETLWSAYLFFIIPFCFFFLFVLAMLIMVIIRARSLDQRNLSINEKN